MTPEKIADHLTELERRAEEFGFSATGFDYLYASSRDIIRYLLSRDTTLAALVSIAEARGDREADYILRDAAPVMLTALHRIATGQGNEIAIAREAIAAATGGRHAAAR